jgi:PPOX class probable F420-dependent enzyme
VRTLPPSTELSTKEQSDMPKPPVPQRLIELIERPNPAVMGTVRPDATPVTVPTWYLWDNGRFLINMDAGRRRLRHIKSNPQISLTVLDTDNWYNHLSVQGRATLEDDPDLSGIDRIARHYTGKPYPDRERGRVNCWIEIQSWHPWGDWAQFR